MSSSSEMVKVEQMSKHVFGVRSGFAYLRKWTVVSVAIGIVAGLGALALILGIDIFTKLFLGTIAGYTPPLPGGEGNVSSAVSIERPWLIPVCTTLGGLVSGLIVARFAPEAKGVGTDAVIGEFHKGHALIRTRIPLVKLLASAITIGSGGTSGREGPIAQIGAGLGTQIAKAFKLTERERRIALAAGLGAGIAAIFKAPLAGAILAGEVFYKHDFEAEAMLPGFIASTVSYSIVGFAIGWQPIFTSGINPVAYTHPQNLILYAVLGVACAAFAHLLFKVFFTVHDAFEKLSIPFFIKPAIGGLATGVIGMYLPSVLGVGYGWAQIALNQNYQLFPVALMFLAIFAEILAMSLTLGSGGSGGIFGPCVVTGTLIGATFGYYALQMFPGAGINPSSFAIVGMMAFFGAAAKSPLAVIVMIAEMTGGYGLLAPSMIAVLVAFLLSGNSSVFYNQVNSVEDSPAHFEEYETLGLKRVMVSEAMTRDVHQINPTANLLVAQDLMEMDRTGGLPVVSDGRLIGMITRTDVLKVEPSKRNEKLVSDVMARELVTAYEDEDLFSALTRMITKGVGRLPVVAHDEHHMLIGIITRTDIANAIENHRLSKHSSLNS
ncbi:MAG TPA: chloride channel protein [Candidatus Bathyarchaeia archaeon]|nr:chloride channel protein [Candidatus Bathyarchaeia archaeon]